MKSKTKHKIFGALAVLALALPMGLGMGSKAHADETNPATPPTKTDPTTTQTVILHKKQFSPLNDSDKKQNTGDTMPEFGGKDLAGAVFTAYDVTDIYWNNYTGANEAAKETNANKAAMEFTPPENNSVEFAATGNDGSSSKKLKTVSNGKNAVYKFVETKSPAGVVQSKSVPFILGLPSYDTNGNLRDSVNIYPKNEVKTNTLEITKYGVKEDGTLDDKLSGGVLPGANFILKSKVEDKYYDLDTNSFDADEAGATVVSSDSKGKVAFKNLILEPGTYEFYEKDGDKATSTPQTDVKNEKYHFDPSEKAAVTAIVDTDMNVTYTYKDINRVPVTTNDQNSEAKAYNYKVPAPVKEVDGEDKVDAGTTVTYKITQKIPEDIDTYTTFDLVDNYDSRLSLASDDKAIKDSDDQAIKDSVKIGDTNYGKTITISKKANEFTLSFAPVDLVAFKGETLTFNVKMIVKPGTNLTTINNTIKFDNNFLPKTDTATVTTYGKKFHKIDSNTGKDLAGAEFTIKNSEGKYLVLKQGDTVSTTVTGYASDYTVTWGDDKSAATKLISNDKGEFGVYGLSDDGENAYTLSETKVPDGYVGASDFKFTADSDQTIDKIHDVENKPKGTLPSTGGKGIYAFIAVGVVALIGAGFYFTRGRKHFEA